MRITGLVYLLILLTLSSFLDDAWAASAREASDDVQASANNEYIAPASHTQVIRPAPRSDLALPTEFVSGAALLRHRAGRESPLGAAVLSGIPLVYVHMSLRR
jgi:hypothetical protein